VIKIFNRSAALIFTTFAAHYPDNVLLKTCKICFQNLFITMYF